MEIFNHKRTRTLSLGYWLEEFLNPNIKSSEYIKLAENALKILNVKFIMEKNEATIHMIEFITSTDRWKGVRKLKKIYSYDDYFFWESLAEEIYYGDICSYLSEKMNLPYSSELLNTEEDIPWIVAENLERVYSLLRLKFSILPSFFKNIMDSKESWSEFLKYDSESEYEFQSLIENYPFLSKKISFTDGKIVKYNTITSFITDLDEVGFFPWLEILSHIFFEFLEIGGEKFYILCKHCTRFAMEKKKNRKDYCSDKCRYLANSQRNKR